MFHDMIEIVANFLSFLRIISPFLVISTYQFCSTETIKCHFKLNGFGILFGNINCKNYLVDLDFDSLTVIHLILEYVL